MDMRRHLKHCLTNGDLEQMGGEYEGVISEVIEEVMRNPYTTERQPQPVILFPDGQRIVPTRALRRVGSAWRALCQNIGMRQALIDGFGSETDHWVGRRVRIFLRPMVRKNTNGNGGQRFEKAVECLDRPDGQPGTTTRESTLTAADITWSR